MRHSIAIACAASFLGLTFLSGCNYGDSTIAQWRRNPTPNLMSTDEVKDEIENRETLVNDHNARAIRSDAARFFLLDRPSRLQPGPDGGY